MISRIALVGLVAALAQTANAQYSATYTPDDAPAQTEDGQTGTNQCGTGSSQDSMCQNSYLNSVDDFCLFAPPSTTSDYGDASIGNTERIEVSWCLKSGYGTRVIPSGAITSANFVKTPHYVQVTGGGDLSQINVPDGDDGGELDPHGADGNGNPIGGLVFSSAFNGGNGLSQIHEWTQFIGSGYFCFRACQDGDQAAEYCQHIYDTLGCDWNMPGNYDAGFTSCEGDDTEPMGVYGTSTFYQGQSSTPAAHTAGATSQCSTYSTIGGGAAAIITAAVSPSTEISATTTGVSTSVSTSSASWVDSSSTEISSTSTDISSSVSSSGTPSVDSFSTQISSTTTGVSVSTSTATSSSSVISSSSTQISSTTTGLATSISRSTTAASSTHTHSASAAATTATSANDSASSATGRTVTALGSVLTLFGVVGGLLIAGM